MWPTVPIVPIVPSPTDMTHVAFVMAGLIASTILVFGGFVWLFVHLARSRREPRVVRCPPNGKSATIVTERCRDGAGHDEVIYCSRWSSTHALGCERACLARRAA